MNTRLSMPSTISSTVNVTSAAQALGSNQQVQVSCSIWSVSPDSDEI